MSVKVNDAALTKAKNLISDGQYVVDTDWSKRQPGTDAENEFIDNEGWDAFAAWHLAEDTSESDETKGRYKFPFGDFENVHREGVIAIKQRAAQYDYNDVLKAADSLLDEIDKRENKQKS